MNNSYARLIDGMNAVLRSEVLTRLDDEFARGQVFGVINLLNTFKVRADWSAGFLLQQIEAQRSALDGVTALLKGRPEASLPAGAMPGEMPAPVTVALPVSVPIAELLALRDTQNRAIADWLGWLDAQRAQLAPETAAQVEQLLRTAMSAEVGIELRSAPRPLFAEMSSGRES